MIDWIFPVLWVALVAYFCFRAIALAAIARQVARVTRSREQFKELLLYKFARHVRNTDEIETIRWGIESMELLGALHDLDPERYEQEVK